MKVLIGAGTVVLLMVGFLTCPDHLRQQARDAAAIPPEIQAKISRELDLFVSAMEGETPDLDVTS